MDEAGFLALPDGSDTAARMQSYFASDSIGILDVATAIASCDGRWPADTLSEAAADHHAAILTADKQRLRDGIEAIIMGRDVDSALAWLQQVGVIAALFPELQATLHLTQETGRQHKDVWAHTKQVVRQAVRRPQVRWSALLHDIGKVPTRTYTSAGVHFHGHAEVGARMFDKIHGRFAFARDERQSIRFLVIHHLRTNQYSDQWTDSAVRRFTRELGPYTTDLLDLSRADITSKRPGRRKQLLEQISALSDRAERLAEEDAKQPPLPTGVGNAIMDSFRIAPSRLIGDLKRALEAAIDDGVLDARREDAYYVAYLARHALVPGVDPELCERLAAAGGLDDEADAAARQREAAGDFVGDFSGDGDGDDDFDGDPNRPRPGVLTCGHDPDDDPCAAIGEFER